MFTATLSHTIGPHHPLTQSRLILKPSALGSFRILVINPNFKSMSVNAGSPKSSPKSTLRIIGTLPSTWLPLLFPSPLFLLNPLFLLQPLSPWPPLPPTTSCSCHLNHSSPSPCLPFEHPPFKQSSSSYSTLFAHAPHPRKVPTTLLSSCLLSRMGALPNILRRHHAFWEFRHGYYPHLWLPQRLLQIVPPCVLPPFRTILLLFVTAR